MRDEIKIVEYDEAWTMIASSEIEALRSILDEDKYPIIEHIGSTSVPKLDAKPIIDIVVGSKEICNWDNDLTVLLNGMDYSLWEGSDKNFHLMFIKRDANKNRTHHVHFYPHDHPQIKEHIYFRDILRENPKILSEYKKLKIRLALLHVDDHNAYTVDKTEFVKRIINTANK